MPKTTKQCVIPYRFTVHGLCINAYFSFATLVKLGSDRRRTCLFCVSRMSRCRVNLRQVSLVEEWVQSFANGIFKWRLNATSAWCKKVWNICTSGWRATLVKLAVSPRANIGLFGISRISLHHGTCRPYNWWANGPTVAPIDFLGGN